MVAQQPQVRNVREIDIAFARKHAGREAVSDVGVTFGEDSSFVGAAVAVGINDQAEAIGFFRVFADARAFVLAHKGDAILHGLAGEVVVQPIHVTANIGDAIMQPKHFHNKATSLFVDVKRDRVRQQRFCREQIDVESLRHTKALDRILRFVGGGRDVGVVRFGSVGRGCGQRKKTE